MGCGAHDAAYREITRVDFQLRGHGWAAQGYDRSIVTPKHTPNQAERDGR
jgi:hypothetical protein